jgi:uncharacterized membrane protein
MRFFFLLLFHTVLLRPYVFVFFLIYFLGCSLHLGIKRASFFCIVGYLISWLSEYSSIHNGIPYGNYYYIEQTIGEEIWVFGVPLMDSLSYVFLAYASYSMALLVISPVWYSGHTMYILETRRIRESFFARVLSSFFFVYLDIIIDPVALRGDRWFLGRIYGYPDNGVYFGIPISNFVGWFAVGMLLVYALQKTDKYLAAKTVTDYHGYRYPWRYLIGPALYCGVLIFNLAITFSIREYNLGWVGIFIVLLSSVLVYVIIKLKLSHGNFDRDALDAHLRDFPLAVIPGATRS